MGLLSLLTPASSAADKQKIGVVISTLNNPWFVVLGEAAKARATELGYDATVFDSQNDTAKETAHFENLIARGYKAVLFNPTDANASVANVKKAMGAYQAVLGAGKAEQVKVFGFDGAEDVVKLIAAKKIAATGMQFPKVMAQKAAEFADAYLKGKRDFAQKIPVKVELVTPDNVSQYGDYGKK